MIKIENNANRKTILRINRTIQHIAERVFKPGRQPTREEVEAASREIRVLNRFREALYWSGIRPEEKRGAAGE